MLQAQLTQIILYVQDMARAVGFYRDLLGLKVIYPQNLTDESQAMWVELDAGAFSLALHAGARKWPGDEHELIFTVTDLESARQALLKAGVEIGEIRTLEDGLPIASGVDSEGHRFSIR